MRFLIILVMLVSVVNEDTRLNRLNEVFRGSTITKIDNNNYSVDGCIVEVSLSGSSLSNDSYNEIINCID